MSHATTERDKVRALEAVQQAENPLHFIRFPGENDLDLWAEQEMLIKELILILSQLPLCSPNYEPPVSETFEAKQELVLEFRIRKSPITSPWCHAW